MAQKTTRNEAFNGYESRANEYSSIASTDLAKIKKITKQNYSNIRLLDSTDYIQVKGSDIVEDALRNRTLKDLGYDADLSDYANDPNLNSTKDFYIYGAPYKHILDNKQQYGNCGVDSTLNTLVTAGKMVIKDQNKTETSFTKDIWSRGLADDGGKIGVFDEEDGGSKCDDYKTMLARYNIDSEAYYVEKTYTIENPDTPDEVVISENGVVMSGRQYKSANDNLVELGQKIKQGCGAIVAVCSKILWKDTGSESGERDIDHAIAIIGVVYDEDNLGADGVPTGFIIHDSGAWMTRFIKTEELMEAALYNEYSEGLDPTDENYNAELKLKNGPGLYITFTTEPIKTNNDLNATGDNKANAIYGNSGNNIIKGLNGNDTLYGFGGDDTIYGGNGNDLILGNDEELIYSLSGNNFLYGGNGNDTIMGGKNIDIIYGGKGNDLIYGGDSSDRLFGGSGNDSIHAGQGDDVISAGSGNDVIYADKGNDKIDVGDGNDTLVYDNKTHDLDLVFSSKGSVTVKYTQDANVNAHDLFFDISENDSSSNKYDVDMIYEKVENNDDIENGIELVKFYNIKKNTFKTTYIIDSNGDKYRMSATKSKKAVVADKSTSGSHKNINNILFTLSDKNTTVTTSAKNDIVYISAGEIKSYVTSGGIGLPDEKLNPKIYKTDKITYTSGHDSYHSQTGNTQYSVNFNKDTNLDIYDNVDLLKVTKINIITGETTKDYQVAASANDVLNLSSSLNDVSFFFDVKSDEGSGYTTDNTKLYTIFKTEDGTATANTIKSVAGVILTEEDELSGKVAIDSFFTEDKEIKISGEIPSAMYGNGRIETVATKEGNYQFFEANIVTIKDSVVNWLNSADNTAGYDSVFEALQGGEGDIDKLIACYTQGNVQPMP